MIQFAIQNPDGSYRSEEQLLSDITATSLFLKNTKRISGKMIIASELETCEIEDELDALINNFCFGCISDLLSNSTSSYSYYEQYGKVNLSVIDGYVFFTGDFIKETMYAKETLIIESIAMGLRYIDLIQQTDFEKQSATIEVLTKHSKDAIQKARAVGFTLL